MAMTKADSLAVPPMRRRPSSEAKAVAKLRRDLIEYCAKVDHLDLELASSIRHIAALQFEIDRLRGLVSGH